MRKGKGFIDGLCDEMLGFFGRGGLGKRVILSGGFF
jgi:hypothetical protein